MLSEAPEGPLHGVPIAVKDMFTLPWRAPRDGAPRNLQGFGPGESAVYRRLRDAGAVIVGRHEHARVRRGLHRPPVGLRAVRHSVGHLALRRRLVRRLGAAVAARLVAGAVGTDGGGSIRYPAAYCGITGPEAHLGRGAARRLHPRPRVAGRTRADVPRRRRRAAARRGAASAGRSTAAARDEPAARHRADLLGGHRPRGARALRRPRSSGCARAA